MMSPEPDKLREQYFKLRYELDQVPYPETIELQKVEAIFLIRTATSFQWIHKEVDC